MSFSLFKVIPKRSVGIDIGTSAVKLVEIRRWGKRKRLENYGEVKAKTLFEKPFRIYEKSTLSLSEEEISRAIRAIMVEGGIKTTTASFAIPDFSSFFTTFELPPMSKEELSRAVHYEARRHIPLPLSEVTLDWQIVNEKRIKEERAPLKILVVAVPKEVIYQYQRIASLAQLQLRALEAEVFSLLRALIVGKKKEEVVCLVDIGAQSTTCSIIDQGSLKVSHSFDISGNEWTHIISKSLKVSYNEAEELKQKIGLSSSSHKIKEILLPLVDLAISEIDKMSKAFYQAEGKKVQRIIVAGGSALMPGLISYFAENLRPERGVEIANPFSDLFYPPILEEALKEMGPSFAVAVGAALRDLD